MGEAGALGWGPRGLASLSFEEKRLSHCVPVSVSPQLCYSTKVSEGTPGCGGEKPPELQGWAWGRLEVRGGFGMGEDWSQLGLGREGVVEFRMTLIIKVGRS